MRIGSAFTQFVWISVAAGCTTGPVSSVVPIPGSPTAPDGGGVDPIATPDAGASSAADASMLNGTGYSPDASTMVPPPDAALALPLPPDAAPPPPPDAAPPPPPDAAPPPPPDAAPPPVQTCVPNNTTFPPAGYVLGEQKTLTKVWTDTTGGGIGALLAQVKVTTGRFEAYTFTRADFGTAPRFEFNADLANVQYNDNAVGADYRYIAISECVGDLRLADPSSSDPTLQPACRIHLGTEGPFLLLNFGQPMTGMCNLDPDKTYVFNVILEDPRDGYDPTQLCNEPLGKLVCAFRMAVLPRG